MKEIWGSILLTRPLPLDAAQVNRHGKPSAAGWCSTAFKQDANLIVRQNVVSQQSLWAQAQDNPQPQINSAFVIKRR